MTRLPESGTAGRAPSAARPWLVRLATTLAAWLVAFAAVMAVLSLLGDQLGSLPLGVRALVISGVLVTLMANVVMPLLGRLVARWLAGAPTAAGDPTPRVGTAPK